MTDFLDEDGVLTLWEKNKELASTKQDTLVSGENIRTVNGMSLLGSGNIALEGGSGGGSSEIKAAMSIDGTLEVTGSVKANDVQATMFIVPNGTSEQVLMADGSTKNISDISGGEGSSDFDENGRYPNDLLPTNNDAQNIGSTTYRWNKVLAKEVNANVVSPAKIQGVGCTASGGSSFAFGSGCTASGGYSFAFGSNSASTHYYAIAMGEAAEAKKDNAIALGKGAKSSGFFSTAIGYQNIASTSFQMVVGKNNAESNHAFIVGWGDSDTSRKNIFSVDASGNAYAAKFIPTGGTSSQVLLGNGNLAEIDELGVGMSLESEHAIEADYAETAEKLANARTISLSGGAEGTATAFDGSKNVSIPVTKVNSNVVNWSRDATMSIPPITALAKMNNNNVLAFFKPSALSVEYSTDNGTSWLDYGLTDREKTYLTTPLIGYHYIYLGKQGESADLSSNNRLRITFDFIEGEIRASIKQLLIKFQSGPSSTSYYYIKISYELYQNYKTDTWISTDDVRVTTNGFVTFPTTNFHSYDDPAFGFPYQGTAYPARMRVEFFRTVADTYNLYISNFMAIAPGVSSAPSNMAKMSLPCSLDWQQNATFPANIKGKKFVTDGGTNQQVLLGDGSLKALSDVSPVTEEDAQAIHSGVIHDIAPIQTATRLALEVSKSYVTDGVWDTEENEVNLPVATSTLAGIMSAADKQKLDALDSNIGEIGVPETLNCNTTYVVELETDDTLSITGFVAPTTLFGNYTVHLKTSTNNSISLPSTLLWANGEQPVFEDNTCYELSITATLFDAEYVYKAVLVAFK